MPLLDLKTNLKSLKYGQDQPGGGSSGQPYQQVDINKVDSGFNRFRMTKFDDGLIRGGAVGAANASIVDTFRIGKFLKDFPKGPLWLVKQVGLQLANPKLEAKQLPTGRATSGLGFFRNAANAISNVVNRVTNVIGPTRVYNPLGINTLAQVPLNALGQHLVRFGALPVKNNDVLYFKTAQFNNQGDGSANRLVKLISILGNTNNIDSYLGGASSVYGVGTTLIRRRGDFININQDVTANRYAINGSKEAGRGYRINGHGGDLEGYNNAFFRIGNFIGASTSGSSIFARESFNLISRLPANLGEVDQPFQTIQTYQSTLTNAQITADSINSTLGSGSNAIGNYPGVSTDPFEVILGVDRNVVDYTNPSVKTYNKLIERIKTVTDGDRGVISGQNVNRFGIYGDTSTRRTGNFSEYAPVSNETPAYFNGRATVTLDRSWRTITREERVGSGTQDQINLTPLFETTAGSIDDSVLIGGVSRNINDLVKFRIQSLNYDNPRLATWMIFRAYITQFSDGVNANWNEIQYAGRGDKFYVYGGFGRTVNIGFKVAALSAQEMQPMYQKLNYLMGNLMGEYKYNILHGPLVKMTIGNWFDGQDGILNSLTYDVSQDSPWEIGLKVNNGVEPLILPHVVDVSMTFTPIGSQTKGVNKISQKDSETSHIAQNYNKELQYATKFTKIG